MSLAYPVVFCDTFEKYFRNLLLYEWLSVFNCEWLHSLVSNRCPLPHQIPAARREMSLHCIIPKRQGLLPVVCSQTLFKKRCKVCILSMCLNQFIWLNPLIIKTQHLDAEALIDYCARQSHRVTPATLLAPFGHYPKHTTTAGAPNKTRPTNW